MRPVIRGIKALPGLATVVSSKSTWGKEDALYLLLRGSFPVYAGGKIFAVLGEKSDFQVKDS